MNTKLTSLCRGCRTPRAAPQSEYDKLVEQCHRRGDSIRLLQFVWERLMNEKSAFDNIRRLDAPPLSALISASLEPCGDGAARFCLATFCEHCPYVLSAYFDRVLADIGGERVEWHRAPDALEVDCIEFVLPQRVLPLQAACVLYPNFPLSYYALGDGLRAIVGRDCECFAKIMTAVSDYASAHGLIDGSALRCDDTLRTAFGVDEMHLNQLPFYVRSSVLPLQPLRLSFTFDEEHMRFNFSVALPDLTQLPQTFRAVAGPELSAAIDAALEQREYVELLAAVERNPLEAIEAVIARCATFCELSDESNDNGPKVSVDPLNPARRATPYYWQSWVSEYAPKFLEENKQVHERYAKPQKPRKKKK